MPSHFTLSANSKYFILINSDKGAYETSAILKLRKSSDLSYLLKILLLPICLGFIVKNMVMVPDPGWQFLGMAGLIILIWLGFAWSAYMEAFKMNHYLLHGSPSHSKLIIACGIIGTLFTLISFC